MSHASDRVLTLLRQLILRACSLATRSAGIKIAISMAMIAITTNSSISVNAFVFIATLLSQQKYLKGLGEKAT